MTKNEIFSYRANNLRQQAEEKFLPTTTLTSEKIKALSPEEIQQMFHELQIHQIELEMQNCELQRSHEELDVARARYFDLYDLAPVGYCTISEKDLILEVNLTAAAMLGVVKEALIKQPFSQFIQKEDQDIYYLHRKQLYETVMPQECDLRIVRNDKATLWVNLTATAVKDEDDAPVYRVIIKDISDRKRAEEKIQELNRDFISLLENTGDFIYFTGENNRYRFCSQTIANITGHACWRDIIDKHIFEVFPEKMAQIYYEENVSIFREGKPILNKLSPLYDTLGNEVWIITNKWPLTNGEGKVVGLFGISRDVTEIKQVQDELRKSEERLALALKATQDAIWDWDLVNNTLYYSPGCWQLVGYRENELNPDVELWRRLMHPVDLERINRVIKDAKAKEAPFVVEGLFLRKDGHYVPILIRGIILRDNGGKAIRLSGTATDLTEQKKIEAERSELERQRMQIEKAESLNRMADAIGHHCNNQLYAVIHNLELVLDVLPLGSDESERLIDAMKASHRAADVSRQMLTYLGQAPGKLELQDLSETCHGGLMMIRSFMPKNVSMELAISFPGPNIRANMSQMHQIVTSLVTNAWESVSENKGTITISVKTFSAANISLSNRFPVNWSPKENLYACIEVADTGIGITNADMEKIFDPFFTTKSVGRGLDLAVVLRFVSFHDGGLTVESEVGKGSIFRVFLPVSAEAVSV